MSAQDIVVTITTETQSYWRGRRALTYGGAVAAAAAIAVLAPLALDGPTGGTTPASAVTAYSRDARDLELDCAQWSDLTGAVRQEAAGFYRVTEELAAGVHRVGSLRLPTAAKIAAEGRRVDAACHRAVSDPDRPATAPSPLVLRAIRDFA